jgi:transposase InsO family protein
LKRKGEKAECECSTALVHQ